MTIKKTFFTGALFLLLLVPSVSHASTLTDFEGWLGGILLGTSAEQQTATAETSLPATADWLDLKANDSDGPISVADGAHVSLRWVVRNISGVSNCHVGYPGSSGQTTDNVAVFGSKSVVVYPSHAAVPYIELVCTRGTEQGHDFVRVSVTQTSPHQNETGGTSGGSTGAGGGTGGAGNSGSGSAGVNGVGTGNTYNVGHTGAQVSGHDTVGGGSSGGGNSNGSGIGHAIGGYVNTAGKIEHGIVNSAINGTIVAGKHSVSFIHDVIGAIGHVLGFGGGNNGGAKGGDFGGAGKGGDFGGAGKGGDFGGAGKGGGSIGGGGKGNGAGGGGKGNGAGGGTGGSSGGGSVKTDDTKTTTKKK